jgi:predicted Co/Zn/Cd cation transporter (cation efflux family)
VVEVGGLSREERLLRISVGGAVVFAVTALVWGVLVRSQLIVFDGLYSTISVALSAMSLVTYRLIARGPDERHPFGREVLSAVVVLVKGVAIGVLCAYALATAVVDLLGGGREVAAGWAAAYAAAATAGCGLVVVLLRRGGGADTTSLIRAESSQWLLDTVLSAAILLGFLVALALERAGRAELAAYVDPGMVAVVALWFLRLPAQLVREGWEGLVALRPDDPVAGDLQARVGAVAAAYGFTAHLCRVATFGDRVDVEVELLVGDTTPVRDVEGFDLVRRQLETALRDAPTDARLAVSFTADATRLR